MLSALKFVQGAVAKKDFVPALTHFRIHRGHIKGFDGQLAICSPIGLDIDASPRAAPFVKAIAACPEDATIALNMASNGKLVVRCGNFKANIDCDDPKNFPDITPTGQMIKLNDSLMPALATLEPFIAEDASRPWACGVLFDGATAFATNNIVIVQYWLGFTFPGRVNIPSNAIRELLRIKEQPTHLQVQENRLTFHYEDGRWLSTQLFSPQWPDTGELLDRFLKAPASPPPAELWPSLEQLLPFTDEMNRVYFYEGVILATTNSPNESGTSVVCVGGLPAQGIYNAKQLLALRDLAKHIGFDAYPAPVPFFGERTRGVIAGIRL